ALLRGQHLVFRGRDGTVDSHLGRHAGREVQVGSPPLHHVLEQLSQGQISHVLLVSVVGHRYILSAAVSLRISSTEVIPRFSLRIPSRRSVSMPPCTAVRLISTADARCRI